MGADPPDRLVNVEFGDAEFVSDFCVLTLTILSVSNCFPVPVVAFDSTDCCLSSLGFLLKLEIISESISFVSSVWSNGSSVIIAPLLPDELDVEIDKGTVEIETGMISALEEELAGKTTNEFVVVPVSLLLDETGITTERIEGCDPILTKRKF